VVAAAESEPLGGGKTHFLILSLPVWRNAFVSSGLRGCRRISAVVSWWSANCLLKCRREHEVLLPGNVKYKPIISRRTAQKLTAPTARRETRESDEGESEGGREIIGSSHELGL
ncbi:hypothetical protein CRG98_030909, partial [Punica granatum]